ncbi:MAG: hypothetical protein AAGF92_03710 [Myxococcota bacterium]
MTDRQHLWFGAIFSLVVSALVLAPAFLDPTEDSFPLSTFPMFSRAKRDPGLIVTQVLAVMPDGTRKPLPPTLSTGNEEVIQTLRMIRDAVYGDRQRKAAFCDEVAARVRSSGDEYWQQAKTIEIARSHFDSVAYFETGPTPVTRKALKRCSVNP